MWAIAVTYRYGYSCYTLRFQTLAQAATWVRAAQNSKWEPFSEITIRSL